MESPDKTDAPPLEPIFPLETTTAASSERRGDDDEQDLSIGSCAQELSASADTADTSNDLAATSAGSRSTQVQSPSGDTDDALRSQDESADACQANGEAAADTEATATDNVDQGISKDLDGAAQEQHEAASASEVPADAAPEELSSRAKVPPLTLTLSHIPEELPPQLAKDFVVDRSILGEGAYAAVRRLRHRETGDLVALKVVEKHPLLIRNMLPQLQREIGLQGRLHHRHILQILSCIEDETHVYMMLEYCAGGSMRELAAQQPHNRFPEQHAAWYFTQVLMGVAFMHQNGIVHRDLKHENILITANNEVRICDFGWSAEVTIDKALLTTCGTPHMWAPEIFEGRPQSFGTDLWTLGNLLYEALVGHQPFWGTMDEIRQKVMAVDLRYPPDLLSQAAIHLFYCFLQLDPNARVPAYRLLNEHPWITPVVAELARVGLVAQQGQEHATRPPVDMPLADAAIECYPFDTPIAACIDVEGPGSFAPPVESQQQVPDSCDDQPPPLMAVGGEHLQQDAATAKQDQAGPPAASDAGAEVAQAGPPATSDAAPEAACGTENNSSDKQK